MQKRRTQLQERLYRVQAAQNELLEAIKDAHEAGMPLRAIAHNVGVNHERVRRAIADEIEVKPF
jgi:transposase-like protein